jgi:hypothetical protein
MANIDIPKPNIRTMEVNIYGTQPLIFHKFSEKALKMIQDIQAKSAKAKRQPKTKEMIEQEYNDSFYYDESGKVCFPALNIKNSMVGACRFLDLPMTQVRGAVFVEGNTDGLIPVKYKEKVMRTDQVRVGRGQTDIRYRGEVRGWSMTFNIRFNANFLSAEQVMNLLETAGFSQGLGEWRPERDGVYGTFTTINK